MTLQEIRTLDGPALTRLAFTMGFAPTGTREVVQPYARCPPLSTFALPARRWDMYDRWAPHERLDQADAVWRKLRDYEYGTTLTYTMGGGKATAWHFPGSEGCFETFGDSPGEEALALLRVACLAVASTVQNEYT